MEDPLHHNSSEFTPGYSSYLFNQLLQRQFYSSSTQPGFGISLNINNITFNTNNATSIREYTFVNGEHNNVSVQITGAGVVKKESKGQRSSNASSTKENINSTVPNPGLEDGDEDIDAVSPDTVVVQNIECDGGSPGGDGFPSLPIRYKSTLFLQLLTQNNNKEDKIIEDIINLRTSGSHKLNYPVINLLETFGEIELLKKNKKRLQGFLYSKRCNKDVLKMYTRKFVPSELRPMIWQLLFDYLPEDKLKREDVLLQKQNKYLEMLNIGTLLNVESLNSQIEMDVKRTMPEGYETMFGNERIRASLGRVLMVWALQHPATGYFQGLNDLASIFLANFLAYSSTFQVGKPQFFDFCEEEPDVEMRLADPNDYSDGLLLRVEADVYWCLCTVLDNLEFLNAGSKCGVHAEAMMTKLETLIKRIDPPLDAHMSKENLEFVHFAFPWMLCLFVRELSLDLVMVLWDYYASCEGGLQFGFSVMHVYVCAAFMEKFRFELLNMEFPDMLRFLHRPPTNDWTTREVYELIDKAKDLYNRLPTL